MPSERAITDPPVSPPVDQMSQGPTLRDYLHVLRRRWWVIALVAGVAAAAAYGFSLLQTPVYEARTDLIYERELNITNPLTGQGYTDLTERATQLRSVDAVIRSPELTERVDEALGEAGVASREFEVRAEVVDEEEKQSTTATASSVVAVYVRSEDPAVAAAVADAYAESFVAWRQSQVRGQIATAVKAIREKLKQYTGAATQSTDYLILQQRLRDLQILYSTASGNFRVLVPAAVPESPVEPQPLRSALLGLGVGLFAGIGLAFLLEQFDTRLRRPEDVAAILHQPVLGRVPRISRKDLGEGVVVALRHPGGQVAEAFRLVRTNLEFMNVDGRVGSLLVTSCLQGEGKSVSVANLAVTMAMAGKKVVVVDGDLRRPRQHSFFGLSNESGVSTVVSNRHTLAEALQPVDLDARGAPASAGSQPALGFEAWSGGPDAAARLFVLTSGPLPPNPGEIVASQRFADIVGLLAGQADIVVVDSPAMLAVGDTAALADKVDGLVFLVDMGVVRRPNLLEAADQLAKLPCAMMGIVLRVDRSDAGGYYYGSPYGYYAHGDNGSGRRRRSRSRESATAPATTAMPAAPQTGDDADASPERDADASPERTPRPLV